MITILIEPPLCLFLTYTPTLSLLLSPSPLYMIIIIMIGTSSSGGGAHTGSIVQVLEPLIDSFGTTARLFALFVIQEAAQDYGGNPMSDSRGNTAGGIHRSDICKVQYSMMVSVRKKMNILLANR